MNDPETGHRNPRTDGQITKVSVSQGNTCTRCGAWRGELGLEPTPELFVEHIVAVMREARRVLRADGTAWVNLGDSYCGAGGTNQKDNAQWGIGWKPEKGGRAYPYQRNRPENTGLKPKDLVGIPWRVAFALQADGWYLRSDIIWHKPNPMPESVRDRPTKAHEYIFLMSKQPRYYYDADAVREPLKPYKVPEGAEVIINNEPRKVYGGQVPQTSMRRSGRAATAASMNPAGRNRRSVWTVTTQPYSGAHFATFPPKLIEPCILAGCPKDGTVLDPFNGAGTTGLVALQHGRNYIGIDLKPEYLEMTRKRLDGVQMMTA